MANQPDFKLKRTIIIFSLIFFLISLTQKCYCTTTTCSDSIMVLLLGWAAIFSSAAGIAWFANPLLLLSWIFLRKKLRPAMFCSVFAALLSLSFLLFDQISDNGSNQHHQIISYHGGYWLWLASSLTMLSGTFVLMYRQNMELQRAYRDQKLS